MRKKVGRVEKISFEDLEIFNISAKIDTGAFSSSLHVDDVFLNEDTLHFRIGEKSFEFHKFDTIEVKNSFGKKQKRFLIRTKIKLGHKYYKLKVSLSNRKKMKYPVLIGRRFLYKFDYLVDVKKKFINDKS